MDNNDLKEELKAQAEVANRGGLLTGLPFQPFPSSWQELIRVIEGKNSWGKNELKDEILKILVKYIR